MIFLKKNMEIQKDITSNPTLLSICQLYSFSAYGHRDEAKLYKSQFNYSYPIPITSRIILSMAASLTK